MYRIKITKSNQKEVVSKAIETLNAGGLIIYPTETCYGVGVDVTNQKAVEKLLKYKQRPAGKAISITAASKDMAKQYVDVNKTAENLYDNFLPGPITVISVSTNKIAQGIAAEDGSLGVRIPDYPFTLDLIAQFGRPITATSANLSGRKTPYTIDDILNNASEKNKKLISLIIDAGELPGNPPSTVVDTRLNDEKILREGSLGIKKLRNRDARHFELDSESIQSYRSRIGVRDDSYRSKTYTTKNADETQKLASRLVKQNISQLSDNCIIFALQGELGAGKTQFAKGIARALAINENVTSPTFVLVKEYDIPQNSKFEIRNSKLFHIDTWRMQDGSELTDLGFNKMIRPGNVIVIEWVEKVNDELEKIVQRKDVAISWIMIEDKNGKLETRVINVQKMYHGYDETSKF